MVAHWQDKTPFLAYHPSVLRLLFRCYIFLRVYGTCSVCTDGSVHREFKVVASTLRSTQFFDSRGQRTFFLFYTQYVLCHRVYVAEQQAWTGCEKFCKWHRSDVLFFLQRTYCFYSARLSCCSRRPSTCLADYFLQLAAVLFQAGGGNSQRQVWVPWRCVAVGSGRTLSAVSAGSGVRLQRWG